MKILAVDTSTASGSIALLDGARLMAEWTLQSAQTHNRRLLKNIDLFLSEDVSVYIAELRQGFDPDNDAITASKFKSCRIEVIGLDPVLKNNPNNIGH